MCIAVTAYKMSLIVNLFDYFGICFYPGSDCKKCGFNFIFTKDGKYLFGIFLVRTVVKCQIYHLWRIDRNIDIFCFVSCLRRSLTRNRVRFRHNFGFRSCCWVNFWRSTARPTFVRAFGRIVIFIFTPGKNRKAKYHDRCNKYNFKPCKWFFLIRIFGIIPVANH